jgi:AraC family transcriptional regulator
MNLEEGMQQYLGENHYPFSPHEFSKLADMHVGASMVIFMSKSYISLPVGTHVHSSYEFIIPQAPMPISIIGKKLFNFELNKLYPINCDQLHGPIEQLPASKFITFQLKKQFIQDMSNQVYGKSQLQFRNTSYKCSSELQALLRAFVEESSNRQAGYNFIIESLSTQIAIYVLRQIKHNIAEPLNEYIYSERDNINRAIDFLSEYYNGDYSLHDVAKVANLSTYHFVRVFKGETGKTPIEYLLDIKIENAKSLLMNKNKSISEVCYDCGFSNPSHFSRVFKTKIEVTPSSYRNSLLGKK